MGMSYSDRVRKYGLQTTNPQQAYKQAADKATAANEKRYKEITGIWDNIISQYQPGGSFGQGALAMYEQGKKGAMATGMQSLVSSGLSNTTVAAGLPIKYEQEVGTPFRLQLEDMRINRLSEAQAGKAGAIERRTDAYPDPNLFAGLTQGASNVSRGSSGTSSGSSYKQIGGFDWLNRSSGGGGGGGGSGGEISGGFGSGFGDTSGGGSTTERYGNRFVGLNTPGGLFSNMGANYNQKTESMPEDEYQKLLQENLERNKATTASMGNSQEEWMFHPTSGTSQLVKGSSAIAALQKKGWKSKSNYTWTAGGTKQHPTVYGSDW